MLDDKSQITRVYILSVDPEKTREELFEASKSLPYHQKVKLVSQLVSLLNESIPADVQEAIFRENTADISIKTMDTSEIATVLEAIAVKIRTEQV